MASRDRIITIGGVDIKLQDLAFIYDTGTLRKVYFDDTYTTTTDTISTIQGDIPELTTLTDKNGMTVYVNPISLEKIAYTANNEVVLLFSNTKLVINSPSAADVIDTLNSGLNSSIITVTTSVDYVVETDVQVVFVDTAGVTITIPATRTSEVTVINTSNGSITVDPITNTIAGNDTGTVTAGSSWDLILNNTNWILR